MSKIDNFAYPTAIPAKILECSLWSRPAMLGSAEGRKVRLISREIVFEEFQRVWSQSTNATDRRTDTRTTYHGITALYVTLRAVKPTAQVIFNCLHSTSNGSPGQNENTSTHKHSSGPWSPHLAEGICWGASETKWQRCMAWHSWDTWGSQDHQLVRRIMSSNDWTLSCCLVARHPDQQNCRCDWHHQPSLLLEFGDDHVF